jgi:Putative peptidoglycan binding domain
MAAMRLLGCKRRDSRFPARADRVRRSRRPPKPRRGGSASPALASALVAASIGLSAVAQPAAARSASTPFTGTALWVAQAAAQSTPAALAGMAGEGSVHTLFVKAGDGSTAEPQFSASFVSTLRAAGVTVCAWTFAYGLNPAAEATVAVAAVHDGAQCLIVDAEGQYDGRYGAAQVFVKALRSQLGARFPIGLAGQAEVLQHPTFPYSVFLGPGGFDFDLPQMYWLELGTSVDATYVATIGVNSIYARPILPVGQIFGAATAAEVTRFRALAGAYGARGQSFFDLDSAEPSLLASLAAPAPRLPHRAILAPTIRAGADGDEVLWAQELLNAGGAHLPVGGFYGAQTSRAVAKFQALHRLPSNGVLGPATWRALSRLHAHEPSWAKRAPDSALLKPGA